jgi:hypothetical protein
MLTASARGDLKGPATNRQPGQAPKGSADRDGAAGGALQLAGKRDGLLSRDQPQVATVQVPCCFLTESGDQSCWLCCNRGVAKLFPSGLRKAWTTAERELTSQ